MVDYLLVTMSTPAQTLQHYVVSLSRCAALLRARLTFCPIYLLKQSNFNKFSANCITETLYTAWRELLLASQWIGKGSFNIYSIFLLVASNVVDVNALITSAKLIWICYVESIWWERSETDSWIFAILSTYRWMLISYRSCIEMNIVLMFGVIFF